jgi:hypothetical protein
MLFKRGSLEELQVDTTLKTETNKHRLAIKLMVGSILHFFFCGIKLNKMNSIKRGLVWFNRIEIFKIKKI